MSDPSLDRLFMLVCVWALVIATVMILAAVGITIYGVTR